MYAPYVIDSVFPDFEETNNNIGPLGFTAIYRGIYVFEYTLL